MIKELDEMRAHYRGHPNDGKEYFWVPADLTIGQASKDMAKLDLALLVAIEGLDRLKLLCESTEPDEDDLHKDLTGWDLYEYILGYQNQIQKILEDKA